VPALEILAAILLVFGSVLVFRALLEADRFYEDAAPLDLHEPEAEEARPLRQAA
jgi:hypothetical protein